ncbi:MAG: dienelactone hydrolase family protein [Mesorhizobium sp.]|uniref:dienelactone hydrolase family protein n=1 Tax=Mesorhizobium sp. TaxID=1871066 RepID=UPI001ACABBF1|nr:dienelactone hydrolase family protein [Mesorhizobium sp.]MBN9216718.1 dienelactone hydrolase family protein [Mesorhizobium sp.]
MATIILFHSVLGLRANEKRMADRMRAAGHDVILPDLFGGAATEDLEEGFAIKDRVGWAAIRRTAADALALAPGDTVLAGISMGAGVVAEFWGERPAAAGVLLLHGLAAVPSAMRPGMPVQLHVCENDPFFPAPAVDAWQDEALAARADVQVFRYGDAGHYFSDPALPDHNEAAARQVWQRCLAFLS